MDDWQGRMSTETTKPQTDWAESVTFNIFLSWREQPPCCKDSSGFLFCLEMTKDIGLSILKHFIVFVLLYFSAYIFMCVDLNRTIFTYPWFCWLALMFFFYYF